MYKRIQRYFDSLGDLPLNTEVTDRHGEPMLLETAFVAITTLMQQAHAAGNKLMFIGNGGSAAIASHMAIDYSKNGGLRSLAFNDGAALTCLSNDLGYENVFAKQMELHARPGDVLIAISSSGKSANIFKAVVEARARGCHIVTLSGFTPANPLRGSGDWNLYVNTCEYGFVELTHLSLCHAMLDLQMGWGSEAEAESEEGKILNFIN